MSQAAVNQITQNVLNKQRLVGKSRDDEEAERSGKIRALKTFGFDAPMTVLKARKNFWEDKHLNAKNKDGTQLFEMKRPETFLEHIKQSVAPTARDLKMTDTAKAEQDKWLADNQSRVDAAKKTISDNAPQASVVPKADLGKKTMDVADNAKNVTSTTAPPTFNADQVLKDTPASDASGALGKVSENVGPIAQGLNVAGNVGKLFTGGNYKTNAQSDRNKRDAAYGLTTAAVSTAPVVGPPAAAVMTGGKMIWDFLRGNA